MKRLIALTMALIMAFSTAAMADTVITADRPILNGNGSTNTPSGTPTTTNTGFYGPGKTDLSGSTIVFAKEEANATITGPAGNGTISTGNTSANTKTPGQSSGTNGGTADNPIIISGGSSSGTASNSTGAPTTNTTTNTTTGTTVAQVNINSAVAKPSVASQTAVLYDATTKQILFNKNADTPMFPASTTKLMTALLVVEKLNLNDSFTFTASAATGLEEGYSNVSMTVGDTMNVKDALYAMLLKSACEVANGLGEKVAGSQSAFVALMNQRAKELGCTNTHFENTSGLNGASHYTTAHDMALIAAAAMNNSTIRTVLQTRTYTLPASRNRGQLTIQNSNKMLYPANGEYYAGVVGGKTGYTSKAGNTFASMVEYNGHQLVAVVFKSNFEHYNDSKALYDYGKKLIGAGTGTSAGTTTNTTTTNTTTNTSTNTSTGTASAGAWEKQSDGRWKYKKGSGTYCTNEWLDVNGNTYFFGSDSIMCTGWKQFTNGNWYYFNTENGAMVKSKWVTQNGKSYYLQASGVMAVNTVIDGKYRVDGNGVYVEKVG